MRGQGKQVAPSGTKPERAEPIEDERATDDDAETDTEAEPPDTRRGRRWGILRRRNGVVTLDDGRRIIRL